jgi:propanediol utilization protein
VQTLLALLSFALLAQPASAAAGRVVTLVLPHTLAAGETAWIELKLGVTERGAEIEIATTAGQSLGVISPFGIRSGDEAGTYTVPVPADAISGDHVSLRLTLNQYGHAKRAPTAKEVVDIRVKIMPATPVVR